ncbi:tRNA (adenosine(37)-N6)-threonylcarbamoyltransferase complex dimerization subunit type 1 TsaB [Leminorella grimontii]|uniref:tRNA threonylcarbamoyladenosine biosynthesis protein TsaB n=1 Tax=Leminorella grimontii TaxID=82981 RepID=A0AAV5MZI2_9GAMM|nr:tRNA (adenosine(37)-N6)-threonylcarbamoyltransferase complex dimerization subunit type 1 TsaB [Leminorella grimontii]KFC96014.1 putative metal-dependent protease molecular chaperone [Leminorella grimontii ATCC 33999 = DSM 5078]GKX54804.1 tRNA (adenosine(37)-N6)-threonylcarbamoyltransferase complex dimerization subunit type 1 TsaB [Leminorella grimontii]GKX58222.1 tRNA (adenosine(37)-N6)-threonylcarbamoyltransferase complex dimerization subunit type 1 TsaB [Leminorella grimontii]VFS58428.1 UG
MSTRILAIDAATEACSVAVWNDGEVHSVYAECPREHAQRLLPMVQQALDESGLTLQNLDALAFGHGPGSFTGVRIAIGITQGLALGAELPVIGLSTLETMAQGAYRISGATRVLSAIDARMSEVYWGRYERSAQGEWLAVGGESVLAPLSVSESLSAVGGEWATVGTGWQTYPDMGNGSPARLRDGGVLFPHAQDMLPLALARWQRGETLPADRIEPVYLRNEVAWKKLPGRE